MTRIAATVAAVLLASIIAPGLWPLWLTLGVLIGGLLVLGRDVV